MLLNRSKVWQQQITISSVRFWHEIEFHKLGLGCKSNGEAIESKCKWFPYNKGGNFRKWYGMNEFVVNWENGGLELRNFKRAVLRNEDYYLKED